MLKWAAQGCSVQRSCRNRAPRYTRSKIRLGNLARFSLHEIDEFRQVGLDISDVKDQEGIEQELSRWARVLADERFDLLEKIALEMARSKGVTLPPKLSAVCGEAEIDHGSDSVPQFRGTPRQ